MLTILLICVRLACDILTVRALALGMMNPHRKEHHLLCRVRTTYTTMLHNQLQTPEREEERQEKSRKRRKKGSIEPRRPSRFWTSQPYRFFLSSFLSSCSPFLPSFPLAINVFCCGVAALEPGETEMRHFGVSNFVGVGIRGG